MERTILRPLKYPLFLRSATMTQTRYAINEEFDTLLGWAAIIDVSGSRVLAAAIH